MYVVCVTVTVQPGRERDFIRATELNHLGSRKERGNLRFDVLQAEEEPSRFFLYEVYTNKEAFADHQRTDHYLTWRQTVADWMATPRQGLKYTSIFPSDKAF
jgi:(4S)-4-hydroxy-5-phosphonooxypentane-2,3-dione isomerase